MVVPLTSLILITLAFVHFVKYSVTTMMYFISQNKLKYTWLMKSIFQFSNVTKGKEGCNGNFTQKLLCA